MQDRTTNRMLYSLEGDRGRRPLRHWPTGWALLAVAVRQMLARLHEAGLVEFRRQPRERGPTEAILAFD